MTLNSIYKPTLLQKLLGKNYKWWYLVVYTIKQNTTYLVSELFFQINQFLPIIAILIISINTGESKDILTYLILGNIYFALTISPVSWDVDDDIKKGKISKRLLQPSNYLNFLFVKSVGEMLIASVGFLIMGSIGILVFFSQMQFILNGFLYLILFAFISFIIRFFIEIIVGAVAFWVTDAIGGIFLMKSIFVLFAGSLFPLSYFGNFDKIIQYLPFAFTFYHPMQIYLDKYDTTETIWVFVGGIAWCIVLYFLTKLVFKLGLKKNESVGL